MFKELKEQLITELNEHFNMFNTELNDFSRQLVDSQKKSIDYVAKKNSAPSLLPIEHSDFEYKYSKSYKFFHKRKIEKERKDLIESIRVKYENLYQIETNKCTLFEKTIAELKTEMEFLSNRLKQVVNADTIGELDLSYEHAKDLLAKIDIDIETQKKFEILQLQPDETTSENVEYMKEAIKENPFCIMYDKTNDLTVYVQLIDYLLAVTPHLDKSTQRDLNQLKENLAAYQDNNSHIKIEHILEGIRFYFKDTLGNLEIDMLSFNDAASALDKCFIVLNNAMELSPEDYLFIQNEYETNKESYDFYMHQAGKMTIEQTIFKTGLSISTQSSIDKKRHIYLNARKMESVLAIAGYHNFYGSGGGTSESRFIIKIPKDEQYPIGSDTTNGNDTYILPKFIIGSIHRNMTPDGKVTGTVIHTNNVEPKVYKYLYQDHFMPGEKYHYKKNPEYVEDIEY